MEIEYLKEFITLAEYMNYTQAAERLYITQPVLSRHIKSLESELGVTLFQRNTQSVSISEIGAFVLERVRPILSGYERLISDLRFKSAGYDGELRIGIPYYSFTYYLGQLPRLFEQKYPKIKLSYLTDHPDRIIEALKMDEVDLLIIANMPFRYAKDFIFHDVFVEPYNVLLPSNHPLAKNASVSFSDLRGETFLGTNTTFFDCTWAKVKNMCHECGYNPPEPVKYNQLESVIIAISQGEGIIIEGETLKSLPQVDVITVPLAGKGCSRIVSLVYKEGNMNSVLEQFINTFDGIVSERETD